MRNFIRLSTFILILCASTGCQSNEYKLDEAMQKSASWLWSQQSPDGGWHSQTHAVLKDGKALTPYILYYLLQFSEDKFERPDSAVEKSIAFIRREIRASITMRKVSLQELNYPNYSAAYALRVLCLLKQDTALQRIIANHLLQEQFAEHRGISPDNLAYGGWGYGEPDLPFGEHGHVDISHTRRIVEALILWYQMKSPSGDLGAKEDITPFTQNPHLSRSHALTLSRLFLQGVQRTPEDSRLYEGCTSRKDLPYDGGFISSLATLPTNKCEPIFIEHAGYYYPSYATATCDGLLALHALGMTETKAYKDAVHWLKKNQHLNTIDGLSPHDPEQWHQVMHYYHFAVRAEAMAAAGIIGPWSKELTRMLIKEQQPEGYYINPVGGVNKEDDPLMATIFAVQAGTRLLEN